MRFKRSDWPGFIIAVGAPPLLFLVSWLRSRCGTTRARHCSASMAVNLAGAIATMAIFSRFVKSWDVPIGILLVLISPWPESLGATERERRNRGLPHDEVGRILAFFLVNAAIGLQVLINGLLPVLDRRSARRRQAASFRTHAS